jgi:hypothetical protein
VALFLIPVTVITHNFWALEGMQRISEFHSFLGNLALLGSALMFLAVPRPWPLSLDTWVGPWARRLVGYARRTAFSVPSHRAAPQPCSTAHPKPQRG